MRKISSDFENPIDDKILNVCDYFIEPLKKYKITPNQITITRIIMSFYILDKFLFNCDIIIPMVGTILFYFFDCLDGHFARGTNQVTILGDYLDHFGDIFYDLVLIYGFIIKNFMYKNEIGTIMTILYYLSFVHLGLQQKIYAKLRNKKNNNELLDLLNYLHPFTEKNIYMTKYFGTGSLTLFKIIVIYWIQINHYHQILKLLH